MSLAINLTLQALSFQATYVF
jgi:mannose/fructose/N-acetylgalactosamine-specific phosphotransferase system component IID